MDDGVCRDVIDATSRSPGRKIVPHRVAAGTLRIEPLRTERARALSSLARPMAIGLLRAGSAQRARLR